MVYKIFAPLCIYSTFLIYLFLDTQQIASSMHNSKTIVDSGTLLIGYFPDRAFKLIDSGIKNDHDSSARLRSSKQNNITSHRRQWRLIRASDYAIPTLHKVAVFLPANEQANGYTEQIYTVCPTKSSIDFVTRITMVRRDRRKRNDLGKIILFV